MRQLLEQFVNSNASAIFALLGAFVGGVLSFIAAVVLKQRDFALQIRSKLVERQIAAHERILRLAEEMRVMVAPGGLAPDGEVRRGPKILMSRDSFDDWFTRFTELQLDGSVWLTTATKREVSFVQDYLVTLHMHLGNIPSERYFDLAQLIRQDFIDLSSGLEKTAFAFFERGIRKGKLDSPSAWRKYKRSITERKLTNTALLKNIEAFRARLESDKSDG